jgi:hypothetical protein
MMSFLAIADMLWIRTVYCSFPSFAPDQALKERAKAERMSATPVGELPMQDTLVSWDAREIANSWGAFYRFPTFSQALRLLSS